MARVLPIQRAGLIGLFGAALFIVGLLIEYHYRLFPPGRGTLYVLSQIMFLVAMSCILVLLWGMLTARAGGDGRFARIVLTGLPIGWMALIVGTSINLITGNADSILVPVGGIIATVFSFLAGIAIARGGRWLGWTRFAPLLNGTYYLLLMLLIIIFNQEPVLLTEISWMATWFLVGLAAWRQGHATAGRQAVQPAH